jgi:hypothetical protein
LTSLSGDARQQSDDLHCRLGNPEPLLHSLSVGWERAGNAVNQVSPVTEIDDMLKYSLA